MNNMGKVFQIVLGGLVFGIGIKKILSLDEENESLKEVNRFLIEENEELKNTISEIDRTVTGMITYFLYSSIMAVLVSIKTPHFLI